jgi:hypothetical protein
MNLDLRNFAIRCYLIGVARCRDTALPTYGDLHNIFGGGYQNQGRFLDVIYEDCVAHDEPDITVLVVNSSTRRPSRFEGRPFEEIPEVVSRWQTAIERAYAHKWSNLRFTRTTLDRSSQ